MTPDTQAAPLSAEEIAYWNTLAHADRSDGHDFVNNTNTLCRLLATIQSAHDSIAGLIVDVNAANLRAEAAESALKAPHGGMTREAIIAATLRAFTTAYGVWSTRGEPGKRTNDRDIAGHVADAILALTAPDVSAKADTAAQEKET